MSVTIPSTLKRGMARSLPNLYLQIILLSRGLNSKIIANGEFDEETETGVRRLQEELGVPVSGQFDLYTQKKLYNKTGFDFEKQCVMGFVFLSREIQIA